jgi:SAM-dependent methyltransferase
MTTLTLQPYSGAEVLEVMKEAKKYNYYLASQIDRHLQPQFKVLDFGAGAGTFTLPLLRNSVDVICVEPDTALGARLRDAGANVVVGLDDVADHSLDLIYTFNVLEHIADDVGTVHALSMKLKPGGTLIVYVPAFNILYSSFDARIGHLRRYRRGTLASLVLAAGLQVLELHYVDSIGFVAALVFRAFIGAELNRTMVKLYDRFCFPLSITADKALSNVIGKNVMVVAKKK